MKIYDSVDAFTVFLFDIVKHTGEILDNNQTTSVADAVSIAIDMVIDTVPITLPADLDVNRVHMYVTDWYSFLAAVRGDVLRGYPTGLDMHSIYPRFFR